VIKNTTAVLQKSRCLSFEQAYIQNVTSILVSNFIIRKCSPDAHHIIENICIFWSFSENKKPCKCLIYRVLMLFVTVLGRERGTFIITFNSLKDRQLAYLKYYMYSKMRYYIDSNYIIPFPQISYYQWLNYKLNLF